MNASTIAEPFTPHGIAAFAGAKLSRLLVTQAIMAMLAAAAVGWLCYHGCFPTIQAAIENLPDTGRIQAGQLDWTGPAAMLAEGGIIAFDVDPDHSGQLQSTTADFQIEFGRQSLRILSLFGYADFSYPRDQMIQFNRTQLEPLWKAYESVILFLIAAAAFILLPLIWWILAIFYSLPSRLLAFFANRVLAFRGSLKFSCAALLPGAFLMTIGVFLYGSTLIGLVPICFIFGAHFILGWLYLAIGLFFLPRIPLASPLGNPFKKAKT